MKPGDIKPAIMYRVKLRHGLHDECVVIGDHPRTVGQMNTNPTDGTKLELWPIPTETPQVEIRVLKGESHFVSIEELEPYE